MYWLLNNVNDIGYRRILVFSNRYLFSKAAKICYSQNNRDLRLISILWLTTQKDNGQTKLQVGKIASQLFDFTWMTTLML
jgi:hypothetical protein